MLVQIQISYSDKDENEQSTLRFYRPNKLSMFLLEIMIRRNLVLRFREFNCVFYFQKH